MNALIVCHAGTGLGLGHLTRCLVAARALHQELGAKAWMLIQGDPVERADWGACEHRFLGFKEDLLDAVRQHVRHAETRVVILDLHPGRVPADIGALLDDLRQAGRKVISIDGLLQQRAKLDLIFIPAFGFSPPQGEGAPILSGWDCYLLNAKRTPKEWKPGTQVLALTGGGDVSGLGKTLPTLLTEALPGGTELRWVSGPYAQPPVCPASPRVRISIHQSPSGLDDLMAEANYAVTVYGVSFFELLYYGVPSVVFSPYGSRDDAELRAIADMRVALVGKNEADAVGRLKELMANHALAASLSHHARAKLSAPGGRKFAQAVAQLIGES